METKELKVQIPEGQEIDWQESAKQEKIVFKKKEDTKPRSTGCTNEPYKADVVQDNNRFQTVYIQNFDGCRGDIHIIVDKETNVKYLYIKNGYGSGLTKLEE